LTTNNGFKVEGAGGRMEAGMFTVRVEDNITGVKAGVDPGSPGIAGGPLTTNNGFKVEGGGGLMEAGTFTVRVEDNITGVKAGVDPGSPGIGGALMAGNLGSKVEGGAGKVDVGSCTEMDGKPAGGPKVCNVLEAPPRREDCWEKR
jgi:hypothetical protein